MSAARSDRRDSCVPDPTVPHRVPDAVPAAPFRATIHHDPDRCSACAAVPGACWWHATPIDDRPPVTAIPLRRWGRPAESELEAWAQRYGEAA